MIQLIDPRRVGSRWANATGSDLVGPTVPGNVADIVSGSSGGSSTGSQLVNNSDFWNTIGTSISSLTDMFGNIFAGAGNKQTDTVANAGANYIVPVQQKSNNTWLWIVLGVALLAVTVVLLRKFKK